MHCREWRWTVPGSHRWGHIDLVSLFERYGERLPGALPCICKPGDIVMQSRNALRLVSSDAVMTMSLHLRSRGALLMMLR